MKTIFISILFILTVSFNGKSQSFISDSVCYYNSYSGERIKCDVPYPDPVNDTYYRDIWEIKRDGDFIKFIHWDRKSINSDDGVGLVTDFRVQSKNEEETTYPYPGIKIKLSSQYLEGIASSTKVYRLGIDWDLYDLKNDGSWDRLVLSWTEANSSFVRVIYCHVK